MHEMSSQVGAKSLAERVQQALAHVSHLLPDQAPIGVFIHHNTLHAFQHLHFHEAVLQGREVYGAEPYLSETRFRELLRAGRMTDEDLEAALADQLADKKPVTLIADLLDLHTLRMLRLRHAISSETAASLRWKTLEQGLLQTLRPDVGAEARQRLLSGTQRWLRLMLEADNTEAALRVGGLITGESGAEAIAGALARDHELTLSPAALRRKLDDDAEGLCVAALWVACREAARDHVRLPADDAFVLRQHRDVLLERYGRDVYDLVLPILIRLSAAYLDEGLAQHPMPRRELGFYRAVRALVAHGSTPAAGWLRAVKRTFAEQEQRDASPLDVVLEALSDLGVDGDEVESYLERMLLTLPGWAGMMARLERNVEDRPQGSPPASLLEFLAVRLVYERAALLKIARPELGPRKLATLQRDKPMSKQAANVEQVAAYPLFQLMQLAGVPVPALRALGKSEVLDLMGELDAFDETCRRRIFQEAFERNYRCQTLDALAAHRSRQAPAFSQSVRPSFQVMTCFDDREESFRRHLEEVDSACETYGAPGFFGAAMRFRAMDDHGAVPLAPVLIKPTHQIEERARHSDAALHATRTNRRRMLARLQTQAYRGTRSLWRGTILNAALGLLALLPMLTRILSPRHAGRIRRWASERLLPSPRTELALHHDILSDVSTDLNRPHQLGFKIDERVLRVATVLENLGFTRMFAPLVVVLGHGASTLNNPHKSAYDCGACGGRQGGPNARVFCQMANEPDVRRALVERGIHIPDDTWFIGGQHDTCNDTVELMDVDRVPDSHRGQLAQTQQKLDEARARTAQERCRRLFSAPEDPSPRAALAHVENRSEHLAEPRPEFGHATNAVAVIGRRALTRGLFLDRRAFLLSYDPHLDATGAVLERVLAAATPVGAGINLEYYFSHVDNRHYGAGSKLPHNVTGLIGVMSGHASDLRTGLPRQMVEIHEPIRLLVIVEATPERLLEIASRQLEIHQLVTKRWIQLVAADPDTGALHLYTDRGFEPFAPQHVVLPQSASSRDYYRGHHGGLPPAQIDDSSSRAA